MYMLKVDFVCDIGLADEGERPIERRFDELVYRSRLVDPEVDWPYLMPPMERFEVSYPVSVNFQDKRLLHEALDWKLRENKRAQLKELKSLHAYRVNTKQRLEDRW